MSEVPSAGGRGALHDALRLQSLARVGLGAEADPEMQAVAERVRRWLGVPIALVSLVEPDRQVFPGMAGLPEPWATSRSISDPPLVLPARRDRDRAAGRVGRPRASPAPGQPGRRGAGCGGLRRAAADRRGGQRPGRAVRDRQRAAAVDGRPARPAARPGRVLLCRTTAPAVPVHRTRGTPAPRRAREPAARLVRPQPGAARRVRGVQRDHHRGGRADTGQRAGEDRAAPVVRRARPARRRRAVAPDARRPGAPRGRGHRTVADLRPAGGGPDRHGRAAAADRRVRRPARVRRRPSRGRPPPDPRPRPARDRGRPADARGRAARVRSPSAGTPRAASIRRSC